MDWVRRRWTVLLGGFVLAAALVLNVITLTDAPYLFGDEAWYASTAWSASEGRGWEPALASGAGVYDGVGDYWAARVGSAPHVLGELAFPTSLTLHRSVSLVVSLLALAVLFVALRRRHGTGLALLACGALAFTFGFFATSHWVRWDGMAILFVALILLVFYGGPPRPAAAAGAGLLIGLSPDFGLAVAGTFPALLLLCAWEPAMRKQRLLGLLGGFAAGCLVFALSHGLLWNWTEARDQYDVVYKPIYDEIPLIDVLKQGSLEPVVDEADRYTGSAFEPFISTYVALAVAALAGLALMLRGIGAPRAWLAAGAGAVLVLIAWSVLRAPYPYDMLRGVMGVLIIGGAAVGLLLIGRGIAREREYPTEAVPAILLASMLVGYGLLLGYKGPTYLAFTLPLAIATVLAALKALSPKRLQTVVPAAGLCVVALLSGIHLVDYIDGVTDDPAVDDRLSAEARELVASDETIMGEWVYWWLYRDQRYVFNSDLWLQQWQHPGDSFDQSFARVCPDWVLLDDTWLARYASLDGGRVFPNQAPTSAKERRQLGRLLKREYREVERKKVGGRTIGFWHRRAADCAALR